LGFLEKNRDTLSDSVVDMFKHSRDDLIRLLFHGNPSEGTGNLNKALQHRTAAEKDARNRLTVGAQYRVKKIIRKISKFLFFFISN